MHSGKHTKTREARYDKKELEGKMRPLILITNDDGINSPGLLAMAESAERVGDVVIVAPACQQTSMGRAFPRTKDLGVIDEHELYLNGRKIKGYGVHGSPAYAVTHGILEIAERKPDLCLSGINYGENLGTNLTCSGTVGAILEASTHQVPGIAFSVPAKVNIQRSSSFSPFDWEKAKEVVYYWTKKILDEGTICGTKWFNINLPKKIPAPEKYSMTKQSKQNYFDSLKPGKRDFSKPFELKTIVNYDVNMLEEDDDIYAVCVKEAISVTPIVHDLTARIL